MTTDVKKAIQHAREMLQENTVSFNAELVLTTEQAERLAGGEESQLVTRAQLVDGVYAIHDGTQFFGVVKASLGSAISTTELHKADLGIDDEVRKQRWPKARRLFVSEIEWLVKHEPPCDVSRLEVGKAFVASSIYHNPAGPADQDTTSLEKGQEESEPRRGSYKLGNGRVIRGVQLAKSRPAELVPPVLYPEKEVPVRKFGEAPVGLYGDDGGVVYIQPWFDGLRVSLQKAADGTLAVFPLDDARWADQIPDYTGWYPELRKALSALSGPLILEGAIVRAEPGEGMLASAGLVQPKLKRGIPVKGENIVVMVDDVLLLGDVPLQGLPYLSRLRELKARTSQADILKVVPTLEGRRGSEGHLCHQVGMIPGTKGIARRGFDGQLHWYDLGPSFIGVVTGVVEGGPNAAVTVGIGPVNKDQWTTTAEVNNFSYTNVGEAVIEEPEMNLMPGETKYFETGSWETGQVCHVQTSTISMDMSGVTSSVVGYNMAATVRYNDERTTPTDPTHLMQQLGKEQIVKSEGPTNKKVVNVAILKREEELQYAFGEVLIPDEVDSQGDIYDEEVVRDAAWYYMAAKHRVGYMHDYVLDDSKYIVVENYLAPMSMDINGRMVKKGTWLLGVIVTDDVLWQQIKSGELNGFSIEGMATVEDLPQDRPFTP